uniref:Laccase domain-containing protein 1 n=1 Tax=Knipowitschia caucasica TaxID=637954 RepID=A0AAV2JZQ7_KNICA
MWGALLVDCTSGDCSARQRPSLLEPLIGADSHVFLLHAAKRSDDDVDALWGGFKSVHVLDDVSTACNLYRFKQALDARDICAVRVRTSAAGRARLEAYVQLLFTAVYSFDFDLFEEEESGFGGGAPGARACESRAHHTDTRADARADEVRKDVAQFMQQLPALKGQVSVSRSSLIPDIFGHGFSSRGGGISYISTLSSLNLFSSSRRKDPVSVVEENRRRLALEAGFNHKDLLFPKVDHGSTIWVLGQPEPQCYDGMVTDRTGVVLAAPGADCLPLLFCDPEKRAIGATHTGWKGTLLGAAVATVQCMEEQFQCEARALRVVVGPSVGVCCYTLPQDQALAFSRIHPDCVPDPESPQPHINLRLANRVLLQKGGVLPEHIHDNTVSDGAEVTACTSCQPHKEKPSDSEKHTPSEDLSGTSNTIRGAHCGTSNTIRGPQWNQQHHQRKWNQKDQSLPFYVINKAADHCNIICSE